MIKIFQWICVQVYKLSGNVNRYKLTLSFFVVDKAGHETLNQQRALITQLTGFDQRRSLVHCPNISNGRFQPLALLLRQLHAAAITKKALSIHVITYSRLADKAG